MTVPASLASALSDRYREGESLRDRLKRDKQLPIEDSIRIAREVASALDFGIALAMQQANGGRMTQTGMSLGTPSYMSPEQAMGEREIGLVLPPFHQGFSVAPDSKSFIFFADRAGSDPNGRYAQVTLNWLDGLSP